jgi:aldose 1-epimerase
MSDKIGAFLVAKQQNRSDITCCYLLHNDEGGQTAAVVVPSWGANVIGLAFQAPDWIWPIPVLESVDIATVAMKWTSYGIPLLAPTPGKVGWNQSGMFTYHGHNYRISPSRHGFLRNLSWTVTAQSKNSVICALDVTPVDRGVEEEAFPFKFHTEYQVEVSGQALRCQLRLQNTSTIAQPINIGWHPYLHRSGPCTVYIPARSRWELDGEPEPTPTGKILEVTGNDDFRKGRLLGWGEHWDDVFTDLTSKEGVVSYWVEGDATIVKQDGQPASARVRRNIKASVGSAFDRPRVIRNVQLFTPPGRRAICLEPLSAPPNALNLLAQGHERADVWEIAPGEDVVSELVISVEVALQ